MPAVKPRIGTWLLTSLRGVLVAGIWRIFLSPEMSGSKQRSAHSDESYCSRKISPYKVGVLEVGVLGCLQRICAAVPVRRSAFETWQTQWLNVR